MTTPHLKRLLVGLACLLPMSCTDGGPIEPPDPAADSGDGDGDVGGDDGESATSDGPGDEGGGAQAGGGDLGGGSGAGVGGADATAGGETPGEGEGEGAEGEGEAEPPPDLPVPELALGELVITEFMANPDGRDEAAEYFEVRNVTARALDLHGLTLSDRPDDDGVRQRWTVDERVAVPPGGIVVFGSHQQGARDGVTVDHAYPWGEFSLDNDDDEIILSAGATVIDEVAYSRVWGLASGATLTLAPNAINSTLNDNPAHWCHGPPSPGSPNAPCIEDSPPGEGEGEGEGDCIDGSGGCDCAGGEGEGEGEEEGPNEYEGLGGVPVDGACASLCECEQGLNCFEGLCTVELPPIYCCGLPDCPSLEACFDLHGEEGFCPLQSAGEGEGESGDGDDCQGPCQGPCDCPQGNNCVDGFCVDERFSDFWCCDNDDPPCPDGHQCVTRQGEVQDCQGAPVQQCAHTCDCPQGQHCQIGECVAQNQELFCCDTAGCPDGAPCESLDGQMGLCGGEQGGSPGDPCDTACDCRASLSCDQGRCAEIFPITWCCDAFCMGDGACQNRDGTLDVCQGEGGEGGEDADCETHCDCEQGQICTHGRCGQGARPKYCCEQAGCPNNQACHFPDDEPGCCDGRPADQCDGGGQPADCEFDCDCDGDTPYCQGGQGVFGGRCGAEEPSPQSRRWCCDDPTCTNSQPGDGAYNRSCMSPDAGQDNCGCCGVDNTDCCES